MLAECVRNHGNCEVTVYDCGDPVDLCHAEGVSVDDAEGGKRYFQIYGSQLFVRFTPKPIGVYRKEGEQIVEQVAKVLAANSPFLACLERRPFINPDEIRNPKAE